MPIQSGALAGYAALRDTLAPQYEGQLDQIAGGLINAFAEGDQNTPATLPLAPRPLHHARRNGPALDVGGHRFAAAIEVNPNVDPSQGGDATLLRDGGISDPGSSAYTYNYTN